MRYELLIASRYLRSPAQVHVHFDYDLLHCDWGDDRRRCVNHHDRGDERFRGQSAQPDPRPHSTRPDRALRRSDQLYRGPGTGEQVKDVAGADAFIVGEAMLSSKSQARGVVVRGIESSNPAATANLRRYLEQGSLERASGPRHAVAGHAAGRGDRDWREPGAQTADPCRR